ncbi:hypothetical protein GWI33_014733, partial [Rhynchophorus ferrugineus]
VDIVILSGMFEILQ